MADPAQQAGGGEQIPVDAPPTTAPEVPTLPEQKPVTTESPKPEPQATEPPKAEPQVAEPPKSETPKAETPKVEPPKEEPPKTEPETASSVDTETSKPEPKAEPQTSDIPSAESQTSLPPTTQPPVAEPSTAEPVKKDEIIEQAKVSTVEILATPTTDTKPELLSQETKEVNGQEPKQDVIVPESKENVESKPTEVPDIQKNPADIIVAPECSENSSVSVDWQKRESELLKKIEELEKVKSARSEDSLKLELKIREEEIDLLKARVKNLETELQAALSKPGGKNHEMIENIKHQHEELLSKARGMIFDKTKMVKNQELQIEALTTQVQSLKDINVITKDLLEIRNSEVKAMEDRFQAMEARFKAEKERYDLVLKRAQTSTNINDDLRKEYETQLAIFKELREKYEQRVQALVAENNRLKEAVKGPETSG